MRASGPALQQTALSTRASAMRQHQQALNKSAVLLLGCAWPFPSHLQQGPLGEGENVGKAPEKVHETRPCLRRPPADRFPTLTTIPPKVSSLMVFASYYPESGTCPCSGRGTCQEACLTTWPLSAELTEIPVWQGGLWPGRRGWGAWASLSGQGGHGGQGGQGGRQNGQVSLGQLPFRAAHSAV